MSFQSTALNTQKIFFSRGFNRTGSSIRFKGDATLIVVHEDFKVVLNTQGDASTTEVWVSQQIEFLNGARDKA